MKCPPFWSGRWHFFSEGYSVVTWPDYGIFVRANAVIDWFFKLGQQPGAKITVDNEGKNASVSIRNDNLAGSLELEWKPTGTDLFSMLVSTRDDNNMTQTSDTASASA